MGEGRTLRSPPVHLRLLFVVNRELICTQRTWSILFTAGLFLFENDFDILNTCNRILKHSWHFFY